MWVPSSLQIKIIDLINNSKPNLELSFPNNIIANIFGCKDAEYFEVELVTRENPKVNM